MYTLDLKSSHVDYATQKQQKYFKKALDFALANNFETVKVNKIYYTFDFAKLEVRIATGEKEYKNGGIIYKLKEVDVQWHQDKNN